MEYLLEPVLYRDPQQAAPVGFCPVCLGEIYGRSGCLRCERRHHDPAGGE